MISNENLGSIMGAPVVGPDDDRIGTVGQVFVDPTTGSPNWVTVHTGLFGRHETFVPLDDADWDREVLRIPYEKGLVKDAPRMGTDDALDPQAEDELYRYYGLASVASSESSGDDSRLRRYSATDQQGATVPTTHDDDDVVRPDPAPASQETVNSTEQPDAADTPQKKERGRHRA